MRIARGCNGQSRTSGGLALTRMYWRTSIMLSGCGRPDLYGDSIRQGRLDVD